MVYRSTDMASNPCVLGNGTKWEDVSRIEYGGSHLVGLHSNGKVSAVGLNKYGECNTLNWSEIVKIVCTQRLTVGLKRDGRVCVAGLSELVNKCNSWNNIVEISASGTTIAGIKSNGEVLAVSVADGKHDYVSEVQNWENIVKIQAAYDYIIGYRADGTLIYAGRENIELKSYLEALNKVVDVVDDGALIILHADGTVSTRYSKYDVSSWTNMVFVTGNRDYIYGVCADGSVVVEGQNEWGLDFNQIAKWRLFTNINSFQNEKSQRLEQIKNQEKQELKSQLDEAKTELASLKGLFTGKRKRELENQIQILESKLADTSPSRNSCMEGYASIDEYIRSHFTRKTRAEAIKFYSREMGVDLKTAMDVIIQMGL